jgi:hypothetical protein
VVRHLEEQQRAGDAEHAVIHHLPADRVDALELRDRRSLAQRSHTHRIGQLLAGNEGAQSGRDHEIRGRGLRERQRRHSADEQKRKENPIDESSSHADPPPGRRAFYGQFSAAKRP